MLTKILQILSLSPLIFLIEGCGFGNGLCGSLGEGCLSSIPSVGSASSIDSGDGTGSVVVTITGTGFVNGMTVTVNGNDCTNVKVITSTQATCVLPNGQIALVNIIITAPNGSSCGSSLSSPLVATTATSTAIINVGFTTWENINNALVNDGAVARLNNIADPSGDYLNIKGYFASSASTLPSTAVIDGIKAKCRWRNPVGGVPANHRFFLTKGGVEAGNNKATHETLPLSLAYSSEYGGNNDLWGTTWTPSEINDSGFGIIIGFDGDEVYEVDNCELSVYWH